MKSQPAFPGRVSSSRGWLVVLALALVTGVGGVLFKAAFRSVGPVAPSAASWLRWALNPYILGGLALGVGARVASYVALSYWNLAQVTLLSSLGIVATLLLARLVWSDEVLTQGQAIGAVLILGGTVLVGGLPGATR